MTADNLPMPDDVHISAVRAEFLPFGESDPDKDESWLHGRTVATDFTVVFTGSNPDYVSATFDATRTIRVPLLVGYWRDVRVAYFDDDGKATMYSYVTDRRFTAHEHLRLTTLSELSP